MNPVGHILVATDFGIASERALEVATEIARRFDAKLTILHAVEEWPDGLPCAPEVRRSAAFRLKETVDRASRRAPVVEGVLREGFAWREITEAATRLAADLVIVGSHGRGHDTRFLIGAVAERVVRVCPVPVLTVHAWRFDDRVQAGRELTEKLLRSDEQRPDVVALSRGGVIVGAEVAEAFGSSLHVMLTRALERDGRVVGAVCEDGTVYFDDDSGDAEAQMRVAAGRACVDLRAEAARMHVAGGVQDSDGTLLLVSDAILEPATTIVAARSLRRTCPRRRLVAAAPVVTIGARHALRAFVDAVVDVQTVEDGFPLPRLYRDLSTGDDRGIVQRLAVAEEWARAVEKRP
ncbi:MAG TPA: universal stress protein [Polyangiaceae bacterium]|nr:universal stress protein [Polyangiaceae bacterium]